MSSVLLGFHSLQHFGLFTLRLSVPMERIPSREKLMTPLSAWSWLLVRAGSSASVHGGPQRGPCARLEGSPTSAFKSWKSIDCLSFHGNFRSILQKRYVLIFFTRNYSLTPKKVEYCPHNTSLFMHFDMLWQSSYEIDMCSQTAPGKKTKATCIFWRHVCFAPPTKCACHAHKHSLCPID